MSQTSTVPAASPTSDHPPLHGRATPVLDVEFFTRFYEFGGLMTYTVRYFDKVNHAMVDQKPTFNANLATERCKALNASGTPALVIERLIPFDGAFAKA